MKIILHFFLLTIGTKYFSVANAVEPEDIVLDGDIDTLKDTIVGGDVIEITKAPYFAQITAGPHQTCGGTIISEYYVVTAAHCVEKPGIYGVLTGSSIRSKGEKHKLESIIVHENYDPDTVDNDIALFKLQNPIKYNPAQKPIELLHRLPRQDDEVVVSGFGKIGEGKPSSKVLKTTTLKVINWQKCKRLYKKETGVLYTKNMFCAALENADTCQGDSGGPALIDGKLAGIVSFGYGCADYIPGTYTQLFNFHKWITSKTGIKF